MLYDYALFPDSHDRALTKGSNGRYTFPLISDTQKVRQQIWLALSIFYGEWFLDTTIGIPYLTDILIKGASGSKISSILRAAIFAVPSVTSINSLTLATSPTRMLTVTFNVETSIGPIQGTVPLSTGS